MSIGGRKRFWERAETARAEGGFEILLDGRRLRSPAKAPLIVPTQRLAQAISDEWGAVGEKLDPALMPMTRMANSAIDKVRPQRAEVAALLSAYGDSDLLCYRADAPQALADRQEAAWGPYLAWAEEKFGARLEPRAGVIHAAQNARALRRLSAQVEGLEPFRLTAFHDLVTLTGSLVLALATIHQWRAPEAIWQDARLDENWQMEQWGEDEEAKQQSVHKFTAFADACKFYRLCCE